MTNDFSQPKLLKHRDMRMSWHLPNAQTPGFIRAPHTRLDGTNMSAALMFIAREQTTPEHRNAAEHFILMREGEVEFRLGEEKFLLEPDDFFFLPADRDYQYTNVGKTDAYFVSILGSVGTWPPTIEYEDGTKRQQT